mmetsp:Transcript_25021/g.46676  ORF Transcript_25021/g.46676 Transcript_25021/m.46676 type:complete len:207 (+) Transcript_25021:135-755(+)
MPDPRRLWTLFLCCVFLSSWMNGVRRTKHVTQVESFEYKSVFVRPAPSSSLGRWHGHVESGIQRRDCYHFLYLSDDEASNGVDNITNNSNNNKNDLVSFESSLDHVLDKARKRSTNLWYYRIRAFFNQPLITVPGRPYSTTFTVYDVSLISVAFLIDARGFAAGLVLAKVTAAPLWEAWKPPPSVLILLLPLWPVLWAIALDQIIP